MKEWVAANIVRWKAEQPDWFRIENIPDEFLPIDIMEAEGGTNRRRSSVRESLREIIGIERNNHTAAKVHPQQLNEN